MIGVKRPIHLIVETGELAGGVRVIGELANRLIERDWQVNIWSVNPKETLTAWFRLSPAVKWYSFLRAGTIADYDQLASVLDKQSGIKVGTFWRTAIVADAVSRPGEGYYLVQDRETSYVSQPIRAEQVMATYQFPLHRFTTSKWVQSVIPDCDWIGIGVENRYRPNFKVKKEPFVLACARIQYLKGWATLCECVRYINAVGAKVKTYGVQGKIPGYVQVEHHSRVTDDKIRQMYQQCGAFLSTSLHEGFNLTALEAMACGAPVSTTDSDGNQEYISDGNNCLVGNSPARLVQNCVRLMQERDLRETIIRNGLETAAKYRWNDVITRLEGVFMT